MIAVHQDDDGEVYIFDNIMPIANEIVSSLLDWSANL